MNTQQGYYPFDVDMDTNREQAMGNLVIVVVDVTIDFSFDMMFRDFTFEEDSTFREFNG